MADKDKKALDVDKLEVAELEDADLEEVAGGVTDSGCGPNSTCPVNGSCGPKPT
ncbi:MAG TPA: hypothetical protein VHB47_07605 [Thermoanaerobaculia bacterium]|jgi:hypothetical protein|nr:hypothetical protein [Thermoanaerobaculia bacterium]